MDFRSEIQQLIARLADINNRIVAVSENIETQNAEHAAIQEEIEVKKTLITQWTDAIEEHESKLKINESLLKSFSIIEKNQRKIDEMLEDLEIKKQQVSQEIHRFQSEHDYLTQNTQNHLNREWREKKQELNDINSAIGELEKRESELNFIVKMFLSLFEYLGWRTNPKAIEQKKLIQVNQDLAKISDLIDKFSEKQQALERLKETHTDIMQQKKHALQQKEALSHREDTEKAVAESKKKVKNISQLIATTRTEIRSLAKNLNRKTLDKDIAEEKRLQEEKAHITRQITVLDKKEQFNQALVQIEAKRSEYLHKDRNKFFKSSHAGKDQANNTANYIALSQVQQVIKKLKTGLEKPSNQEESRILTQIGTQLLLWQIAENTTNQTMPFEQREQAFDRFNTALKELIDQLPTDNPLKDAQEYIKKITAPAPQLPSNVSNKKTNSRKTK